MRKEIRVIDKDKNTVCVTLPDERWYVRQLDDDKYEYIPSVTWICQSYPRGIGYYKWLANKGWDEAEAIKVAAGGRGSKVHNAISDLIRGEVVGMDFKYADGEGEESELTVDEYDCLMSFVKWANDSKAKFLKNEFVVWGDGYAGTVDLLCEINDEKYVVDFKTSQYIWPSSELQLAAYGMIVGNVKLAILQVGYNRNKNRYRFAEIADKFELFQAAHTIWESENKNVQPKQRDYPLELKLDESQTIKDGE